LARELQERGFKGVDHKIYNINKSLRLP